MPFVSLDPKPRYSGPIVSAIALKAVKAGQVLAFPLTNAETPMPHGPTPRLEPCSPQSALCFGVALFDEEPNNTVGVCITGSVVRVRASKGQTIPPGYPVFAGEDGTVTGGSMQSLISSLSTLQSSLSAPSASTSITTSTPESPHEQQSDEKTSTILQLTTANLVGYALAPITSEGTGYVYLHPFWLPGHPVTETKIGKDTPVASVEDESAIMPVSPKMDEKKKKKKEKEAMDESGGTVSEKEKKGNEMEATSS